MIWDRLNNIMGIIAIAGPIAISFWYLKEISKRIKSP